jgi:hypothetical protein
MPGIGLMFAGLVSPAYALADTKSREEALQIYFWK